MVTESPLLMSTIDIIIIFAVIYLIFVFKKRKEEIIRFSWRRAVNFILFGMYLIAVLYLADLFILWVLPGLTSPEEAMRRMTNLHLNWSWLVALVSVSSIAYGMSLLMQVLIPKTAAQFNHLEEQIEQGVHDSYTNFKLLETIFGHTLIMVAYMDTEFNFIKVNRAYAEADGTRTPEDFPGLNRFDLYPNKENQAIFQQVVDSGEPHIAYAKPFEYADMSENGLTYWDMSLVPMKDQNGEIFGLLLSLLDVSDRIEAEQVIFQQQREMRILLDASPDSVFLLDKDFTILEVNESAADRLNTLPESLIGKKMEEVNPEHVYETRKIFLDKALETKRTVRWIDSRGPYVFVNSIYPVMMNTGWSKRSQFIRGTLQPSNLKKVNKLELELNNEKIQIHWVWN